MIKFLKIQYRLKKIDEEYLDKLIRLGRITENDKMEIMK